MNPPSNLKLFTYVFYAETGKSVNRPDMIPEINIYVQFPALGDQSRILG